MIELQKLLFKVRINVFVIVFFRNLCNEIGDKTNVYSLEISMHGYELPNSDPNIAPEVRPYSEEDCKINLH